jgi:hypothetical protein
MAAILVLLNETVTSGEMNLAIKQSLDHASPNHGVGENMVWEQQVCINKGVLQKNVTYLTEVYSQMWSHIVLTSGDGVQVEYSESTVRVQCEYSESTVRVQCEYSESTVIVQ